MRTRRSERGVAGAGRGRLASIALCTLLLSSGFTAAPQGSVTVLAIDGKGWGHGVGMAQDGALAMGQAGASTSAILSHFYPGTGMGRAGGTVRVPVFSSGTREVVLGFPNGGEVRDSASGSTTRGFPVTVGPGGQVRIWTDGAGYHAAPVGGGGGRARAASAGDRTVRVASSGGQAQSIPILPTTTTRPGAPPPKPLLPTPKPPAVPPPPAPPAPPRPPAGPGPAPAPAPEPPAPTAGRPLWAVPSGGGTVAVPGRGHRYRGVIQVAAAGGGLRLVNEVDVEQYLKGMGEVLDPGWPPAALRAQAIAARTYALRTVRGGGEICDDQRCQVYLGQQVEYGAMSRAVADTAGQVVTHGGSLAGTFYSANAGGFSATPEEGFGMSNAGYPYLRGGPYPAPNPFPWTVRVGLPDLAARFGYRGTIREAKVSRAGPSGRVLTVTLDGDAGAQDIEGLRFAAGLGLRSNLFSFRTEQADVAPAPPPPGDFIQAPPGAEAPGGALASPSAGALDVAARRAAIRGPAGPAEQRPWVLFAVLLLSAAVTSLLSRTAQQWAAMRGMPALGRVPRA